MEEIKNEFVADLINVKAALLLLLSFFVSLLISLRTELMQAIRYRFNKQRRHPIFEESPFQFLSLVLPRSGVALGLLLYKFYWSVYTFTSKSEMLLVEISGLVLIVIFACLCLLQITELGRRPFPNSLSGHLKSAALLLTLIQLEATIYELFSKFILVKTFFVNTPMHFATKESLLLIAYSAISIAVCLLFPWERKRRLPADVALSFLAMLIACLIYLPAVKKTKQSKTMEVYFQDDKLFQKELKELMNQD